MKFIYRIGFLVVVLVAIMSAIATAYQPVDVSIRFNGGGSHNKIYAGRDNIMEVMIRNDVPIMAISLGFRFTSLSGPFSWVTPYGTKPAAAPRVMESAELVASFGLTDGLIAVTHALPDSFLLGAVVNNDTSAFPIHSQQTVFCSMKLRIPAGQPAAVSGFCIDNVWYPPAGTWEVVDSGNNGFPPTFNGQENTSVSMPDAPPMCFDIVGQSFIRGDVDDNMKIDLADLTRLIQYMFFGGPAPKYPESADVNSDGRLNIADVVFLVRYLALGGPEPAW
jgi:hypothetical protein